MTEHEMIWRLARAVMGAHEPLPGASWLEVMEYLGPSVSMPRWEDAEWFLINHWWLNEPSG